MINTFLIFHCVEDAITCVLLLVAWENMVHLLQVWKRCVLSLNNKTFTKPVILLIWQFVGTIYHTMLSLTPLFNKTCAIGAIYAYLGLSVVNFLSPIAGYLGDLKCTRFRLLKCGVFFIIAATAVDVTANIPLLIAINNGLSHSILFWYLISLSLLAMVMYILGYMVSNQLHDAPTQCCFTCYYG